MPEANGEFIRDRNRNLVISKRDDTLFTGITDRFGGSYSPATLDSADFAPLFQSGGTLLNQRVVQKNEIGFFFLILAAVLFDYISVQFKVGLSSFMRATFYLPQILPVTAAGLLWGWILSPIGITNAVLKAIGLGALAQNWLGDPNWALPAVSAVIVWVQVGYCLVVFMAGLARIDPSLYEAAELDGANWWARFIHITITMLAPEIFVVVLTTVIASLKVFAPIYVLTSGGPNNATLVPSYLTYYHFFTTNRVGYAASIAVVQTLITIILGIIFLRAQSRQTESEA